MSSQEFPVCSQHLSLSPRLLLPKRLAAFQGTQLDKKPLLEGRYNPGTEALDPGSKMALGISGPLDWALELLGDMSSHWRRYGLPWVCSRGNVGWVMGGQKGDEHPCLLNTVIATHTGIRARGSKYLPSRYQVNNLISTQGPSTLA